MTPSTHALPRSFNYFRHKPGKHQRSFGKICTVFKSVRPDPGAPGRFPGCTKRSGWRAASGTDRAHAIMKRLTALLLLALAPALALASARNCGCGCCKGKEVCCCFPADAAAKKPSAAAASHPLRGVVVNVHPDQSALMVKHEEIPGVMRAMTMMFKVEPAALKVATKGASITGQMSRRDGEWWLHDVKPAKAK
jgi:Cu/Ag efflux protein CusF